MDKLVAWAMIALKFPFLLLFDTLSLLARGAWNLIQSVGRRLYQTITIFVFYIVVAIAGVFVLYAVPIVFGLILKTVNALSSLDISWI